MQLRSPSRLDSRPVAGVERFKSQALLDEGAVLACMAYVDLNPIRAGLTGRVEESDFTSIQQRQADASEARTTLTEPVGPVWFQVASTCSSLACLSVGEYVELIEWSGRILREDKLGMIPADVTPALERLHLDRTHWRSTVTDFNRGFHRAASHWNRLRERANAIGKHWPQRLRIEHLNYSTT